MEKDLDTGTSMVKSFIANYNEIRLNPFSDITNGFDLGR
jgi:hypothetical protein